MPIPSSDAESVRVRMCLCQSVSVVSVIVKRPVLPACAVDGRSRNPLYYYYHLSVVVFFFVFFLPSTSLWGVYSETFIHRYSIPLAHAFTRLCMIFFLFSLSHMYILHSAHWLLLKCCLRPILCCLRPIEAVGLLGTESPRRPPRLPHSS